MNSVRQTFLASVLLATISLGQATAFATDDEIVDQRPQVIGPERPLIVRRVVAPRGLIVEAPQFSRWVFGADAENARPAIDEAVERRLREIEIRYHLSDEKRQRLALAARTDKIQFLQRVDDLRRRFEASAGDPDQLALIQNEALQLARDRMTFLGPESFFAKLAKSILEGESVLPQYAEIDDQQLARHLSNIEGAIRAVERQVPLQKPQRERLADLLSKASTPAKVFGDFDDILVKYQLAQLPDNQLKPLFSEAQWPKARQALDEFLEFGPSLVRRGLIHTGDNAWRVNRIQTAISQSESIADAMKPSNLGKH